MLAQAQSLSHPWLSYDDIKSNVGGRGLECHVLDANSCTVEYETLSIACRVGIHVSFSYFFT